MTDKRREIKSKEPEFEVKRLQSAAAPLGIFGLVLNQFHLPAISVTARDEPRNVPLL